MPYYGTFKYAESEYGQSWSLNFLGEVGPYRGHRFTIFMNQDGQTKIHDKSIEANAVVYLRYLIEGLILKFDPSKKHIMIFSPLIDDLQAGDNSAFFTAYQNTAEDYLQLLGIDFLDGLGLKWDMGMIPFDTSKMVLDSDSYTGTTGTVNIEADANCASGSRISLESSTAKVYRNITEVAGSYRLFVRCREDVADATLRMGLHSGAAWICGDAPVKAVTNAYAWYFSDHIITQADIDASTIRIAIEKNNAVNELWIDTAVLVPISNSKNFPLDVRNQALANIEIDESIE